MNQIRHSRDIWYEVNDFRRGQLFWVTTVYVVVGEKGPVSQGLRSSINLEIRASGWQ